MKSRLLFVAVCLVLVSSRREPPLSVDVADALSGGAGFSLLSYTVNDADAGPNAVTGFSVGAASSSGVVQALRRGNGDGRVYTFTYRGLDVAGVAGSCTATVVVPHDSGQ